MKKQILTLITSTVLLAGCANLCEVDGPCSAKEEVAPKADLTIGPTLFAFNSAVLTKEAEEKLNTMADELKQTGKKAEINGYADITGNAAYNVYLSEERAKAVAKYLKDQGVNKNNLSIKGFGATNFVATNKTKVGRAKNRRVDIVLD